MEQLYSELALGALNEPLSNYKRGNQAKGLEFYFSLVAADAC